MIFERDMNELVERLEGLWPSLDGARIFVTGGTGFIGRWMLEALVRSSARAEIVLLSRDPDAFAAREPRLASHATMVRGDITDFPFPEGSFTHVIHGGADASAALTANDPMRMFSTIVDGTRRVLDFARSCGADRVLFMSSGAVYGAQPAELSHVGEEWTGGPDPQDPKSAYAEGKRAAETLCTIHAAQFGLDVVTARIFALLGPLLALDIHFAAGNFIRDAMAGRPIRVESAGQAVRSYLYAADLACWLWALLCKARPGAVYNVGSEEAVSIADLARLTGKIIGGVPVEIMGRADPGWNPGRYVPSTAAIRRDLGLEATVGLEQAIRRTALSNGWKP